MNNRPMMKPSRGLSSRIARNALFACAAMASVHSTPAESPDAGAAPTPSIDMSAVFAANPRCPVYQADEPVQMTLYVRGNRLRDEPHQWRVLDWRGTKIEGGAITVPKGGDVWKSVLNMPSARSGYFEVHIESESGNTLPRCGTRPAGFVSYAVLPGIKPLPPGRSDKSRFGAQGTNFLKSDTWLEGSPFDPVYPLLGLRWVYRNRRLAEIAPRTPEDYVPVLGPEKASGACGYEKGANLCVFIDAHSLPEWLTAYPDGVAPPKNGNPTHTGQAYPPNDYALYGKLIGRIAAEQAAIRKHSLTGQARNYYEIHWEPDWNWKGTDDEFIQMYESAHQAIHANDPDGLLLGANYGVLSTGNKHLQRLFEKGLGQHLDGIVTHTYFVPQNQTPEHGSLVADIRQLIALTRDYLPAGAPIINSEWGTYYLAPLATDRGNILRDEAARSMRGHLIPLGEGVDTTFFFYIADCGERGGGLFYNLTWPHPVFGATHLSPKPVTVAAALATRLLEGTQSLGAMDYLPRGVMGYAFDRNGAVVAALWTADGSERKVLIPVGNAEVTAYDPMGNASRVKSGGGLAEISLGPVPSYLGGLSTAALPSSVIGDAKDTIRPGDSIQIPGSVGAQLALVCGERILDAGGNGVLKIPVDAPSGKSLLVSVAPDTGEWISAADLAVSSDVALSVAGRSIVVEALGQSPIAGTLTVQSGTATVLNMEVALKSGENKRIDLPGKEGGLGVSRDADLTLRFADSRGSETVCAARVRSSYPASRAIRAPVVDGALRDWPQESFVTVGGKDALAIHGAPEYGGDADLSFNFSVRYDDDALYLAVQVRDQDHCQHQGANQCWKEDSLQVGLASDPDPNGTWQRSQKLAFSLHSGNGEVRGFRESGGKGTAFGEEDDVDFAVVRAGHETVYELSIPWKALDPENDSSPADQRIGMGILVNDVDRVEGLARQRNAMEAFGGMQYTKPENYGTISFEPRIGG